MKQVTAAVIEKDGKILIAQRKLGAALAGKWEFPGGKIEPGETPEVCLRRELMEEFGVDTKIGEFICASKFEYKHMPIELLAYKAEHLAGEFKLNDHDRIAWVAPAELVKYDLSSADLPVAELLAAAPFKTEERLVMPSGMFRALRNFKNKVLALFGGKPAFRNDAELFETVGELISELRRAGCGSAAAGVQAGFDGLNGLTDGWAFFLDHLERAERELPKEAGPDITKKLSRVLAAARYAVYHPRV